MKLEKKGAVGFLVALSLLSFSAELSAQCNCGSDVSFQQDPEFAGPYAAATTAVDVDLGNNPTTFVTEAYWQVYGSAPSPATVTQQVDNLLTLPYWRRIDVVNTFLTASGSGLPHAYSEPWQSEPPFLTAPCKNVTRDVGAVCMFFFSCPGGTNCGMDWADTHVEGMNSPSTLLSYGSSGTGYYTSATDAGFWYRELMDARYAGLSYLLPNCYGPDITNGSVSNLASALNTINSMGVTAPVQIGMFDDTSGWNNPADFPNAPWTSGPWSSTSGPENLSAAGVTAAATEIFQDKWQPFFSLIPSPYWFEVNGHPLIYIYNGGTLYVDGNSQSTIATIIQLLKNDFQAAFGVTPYVVIDIGFSYGEANVADNQFVWNTLSSPYVTAPNLSTYTNGGVTADLAMVKWDPTQRDNGANAIASPTSEGTSVIKNDSLLQSILGRTTNDTFLTIATWNDLGEGTGINRNYDYYVDGQWEPPNYFMNDIRHSQAQITCVPTNTPSANTPTSTPTPTITTTSTNTTTSTPTRTVTSTASMTPSATASRTLTAVPSSTPSGTPTASLTPIGTPSPASTPSASSTRSNTPIFTNTYIFTPTFTPSPFFTFTQTSSLTYSSTPTASSSQTSTPSRTLTASPSSTATGPFTLTQTSSPTASPSTTPTQTPLFTDTVPRTPTPTASFTTTSTASFTPMSSLTASPSSTSTGPFTFTKTYTSTFTPTFTHTSTQTTTSTASFTTTNTLAAVPSHTPANGFAFTPTHTSTPTASFSPTFTPSHFFTFTQIPTPTFTRISRPRSTPVAYPNPVAVGPVHLSLPLEAASNVSVGIFTTSFRKVSQKTFPNVAVGSVPTMELTDDRGNKLADGLYYIFIHAGGRSWTLKLLILQ